MSIKEICKDFKTNNTNIVIRPYEQYLIKKGETSRSTRGYSHFHPSAFGGCIRKMALQYYSEFYDNFKVEEPIDPKFIRICDAGHAYHFRMQNDLAEMGILRGYWKCKSCGKIHGKENKIGIFMPEKCDCLDEKDKRKNLSLFEYEEVFLQSDPKYNFKGNCDGIVELEKGNPDSRYIIDFKSIKSRRFGFLKENDIKYKTQIMIYMWLTGVHKSIIFYEDKDVHVLKELPVEYDEEEVQRIKDKAVKLKKILDNKKLPKRPDGYTQSKIPCSWCEYKKICYKKK